MHFALGPALGQCCGGAVTLGFEVLTPVVLAAWPLPEPLFRLQLYGAGHVTWFYTPPVEKPAVRADAWSLGRGAHHAALPVAGERLSLLELEDGMRQVAETSSGPPTGGYRTRAGGPEADEGWWAR